MFSFDLREVFYSFTITSGVSSVGALFFDFFIPSDVALSQEQRLEVVFGIFLLGLLAASTAASRQIILNLPMFTTVIRQLMLNLPTLNSNDVETPPQQDNNEYEQRLLDAGYDLDTLDIPDSFLDPITRTIMVSPVILLSVIPQSSQTYDLVTYLNFLQRGISICPLTKVLFKGYIPDHHLKLLLEAYVVELELKKKSSNEHEINAWVHNKLLKYDYYNTLFNQRSRLNIERSVKGKDTEKSIDIDNQLSIIAKGC